MPNFGVTDFSQRRGSPFHNKTTEDETDEAASDITENFEVTSHIDRSKQIQRELLEKANKKSAEIALNRPNESDGCFTEVTTFGAFTVPNAITNRVETRKSPPKCSSSHSQIPKSLLGFPSSANTIALDAKADLESDPNISSDVKDKVISKLFTLATMVQNIYESKGRVLAEYEKLKEKHLKEEIRREREQSEQLYKINMSFQAEVVQMIQQLKMDIGATRGNVNSSEPADREVSPSREVTEIIDLDITKNDSNAKDSTAVCYNDVNIKDMEIRDHTEV